MSEDESGQFIWIGRCTQGKAYCKCIREIHRAVDMGDTRLRRERNGPYEREFRRHVDVSEA